VLVRGRETVLVSRACGFVTGSDERLRIFSTVDEAKNFCGGESKIWPEYGSVDLEFAQRWIEDSTKPIALEVLDKLSDVYGVYMEILLAYSDYKEVPADIQQECEKPHQNLSRLTNLVGQQFILKMGREKGWDTEKLIHGWGGEIKNEWTQSELEQMGTELATVVGFIEQQLA
jgi:hypothetical protein